MGKIEVNHSVHELGQPGNQLLNLFTGSVKTGDKPVQGFALTRLMNHITGRIPVAESHAVFLQGIGLG